MKIQTRLICGTIALISCALGACSSLDEDDTVTTVTTRTMETEVVQPAPQTVTTETRSITY